MEENLALLVQDKNDNTLAINSLKEEMEALKAKIARVPFIDTFDLRFKNYDKRPLPSSKAVMFCLMDVLYICFLTP